MSNDKGYIIETVQSSSAEYGSGSVSGVIKTSQAPFSLRPYVARFRNSYVPYLSGPRTATDLGLRTPPVIPPPNFNINLHTISSDSAVFTPSLIFDRTTTLPIISSDSSVFTPSITTTTPVSYFTPLIYAEFETSSSTTVTVTGSQPTYSGTLSTLGTIARPNGEPKYDNTNPFSGSYSINLYKDGTFNEGFGFVDFGTPANRTEWETWASGSFSVSMWLRPSDARSNWTYDGMFWLKNKNSSNYSWMLTIDNDSLGWYSETTSWQWFNSSSVPIVQNQWNHVVYSVTASAGVRTITGYINGHNVGTHGTNFTTKLDTSHTIGLGNWFQNGSFTNRGEFDEVSCWDFALNDGQVNALYNGGSGAYALTALTQSS